MNTRPLDELAARIGQVLESSPAKDIEKNVKSLLSSGLARLDVVPRAEFDIQAQVLLRTREKLEALERRLTELETRVGSSGGLGASAVGGAGGYAGGVGSPATGGLGASMGGAMPGPGAPSGMGGPAPTLGEPGLDPNLPPR